MQFQPTQLDGAWLIVPEPIRDERGFFARTFCTRELRQTRLESQFVQHSASVSLTKGTLRGMHFQKEPHGEVKIVTCVHGAIFDVIIDLRPASPSFRRWQGFQLTADNRHRLYIPKGFAHGFQTLTDNVEVGYLISAFYEPGAAAGVRHDDPAFAIDWPLPVSVMSEKDKNWPVFRG
jgi:dTDP-4-dehydrorhamnose 3,5-epimerase